MLGVEHILGGADHRLFVLELVLVVGRGWAVLLKTITAFIMTHSIALALAMLGFVANRNRARHLFSKMSAPHHFW